MVQSVSEYYQSLLSPSASGSRAAYAAIAGGATGNYTYASEIEAFKNTMPGIYGSQSALPAVEPTSTKQNLTLDEITKGATPMSTNGQAALSTLPWASTPTTTSTGFFDSFGNLFSSIGDFLPIILMMTLFGGSRGKLGGMMTPLLMLMMMGSLTGTGAGSSTPVGGSLMSSFNVQEAMFWGLLPKLGTMASMLLGGSSALIGQSLFKKRTYRRRRYYRSYYRPRYYRRRR
jgi:hypothetical protein